MSHLYFVVLGALQGLTEFLPVSSSGHLASIQYFFSTAQKESLSIEIMAHLGSLFSILAYYRKAFIKSLIEHKTQLTKSFSKLFVLFLSTLPAGILGLMLKDHITQYFSNIKAVAFGFFITSLFLLFNHFLTKRTSKAPEQDWPTWTQALFIGVAQAFALFPGVSRSGSTIAAGLTLGLKPKLAAFFSFCSVAPLILAASALSLLKLSKSLEPAQETNFELLLLLGSSFLFGWLGLSLVVRFLERNKFHYFSFYLIPLSFILFIWG